MLIAAERNILLKLAATTITYALENSSAKLIINLDQYSVNLVQQKACFVTLNNNNQLRGCIGTLIARSPLVQEVVDSAWAAAFKDPRFSPVTKQEASALHIHISVLTVPVMIQFSSEQNLLSQLQPYQDGLILKEGNLVGTFLPSVWEQLPNPKDFLNNLKMKAGLPKNYWSDKIEVFRYATEMFS